VAIFRKRLAWSKVTSPRYPDRDDAIAGGDKFSTFYDKTFTGRDGRKTPQRQPIRTVRGASAMNFFRLL